MRLFLALLLILVGFLNVASAAEAQTVAKVVGVTEKATLQRGGKRIALSRNVDLQSGDKITTNATGEVQIVFLDRSRVLIGPGSVFRVQNVKISSGKKASKFAVRALGGSFRFLSGDSDKKVYEIKTPSVTMGIRGTEFDFIVASRSNTRVVTYTGEVQVCNRRNRCARVIGGCGFVTAERSRLKRPETAEARLEQLATDFPFVANQSRFASRFRVQTHGCGDVESAVEAVKANPPKPTTTINRIQRRDAIDRETRSDDGDAVGYSEEADES